MTIKAVPNPMAPMPAVVQVWEENRELVDRFRLTASPGGVVENSWFVMVHCGIPDPNVHELVDALHRLERLVEVKSGLDVSLMLSNGPAEQNGTPQ